MRQEGRAGKFMCRYIVYSMWEDVEQRSMILGVRKEGAGLVAASVSIKAKLGWLQKQLTFFSFHAKGCCTRS